jgi:hypothetical protein
MKPQHSAAGTPTKSRPARTKAAAAVPAAAAAATAAPAVVPREDFIREAAYFHFEARGGVGGHELEDWLRAEAEFERLRSDGTPRTDAAADEH